MMMINDEIKHFTGLCKIIDIYIYIYIYIINNRGPRIEPCGMPVVIGNMFDFI